MMNSRPPSKHAVRGQLAKVRATDGLIDVAAIEQPEPLAWPRHRPGRIPLAEDEECFAVMLPDDLVLPYGIMETMLEVRQRYGGSVLCAVEVPRRTGTVFRYRRADSMTRRSRRSTAWSKSRTSKTPRRISATGRYLLDRQVRSSFPHRRARVGNRSPMPSS